MYHCMTPNYLTNILHSHRNQGHNYNTRTSNSLQEINSRTKLYFNSFFPATIRKWNTLPRNIQLNPSLSHFKKYLNAGKIKIPNYFYFGARLGQTIHAKLRLECSTLNLHMFQRKLCNSPLCICGEVESTEHFLLHCIIYSRVRSNTILTLPHQLNVELLLYGKDNLSENENSNNFYLVQKFLVESKRF